MRYTMFIEIADWNEEKIKFLAILHKRGNL